MFKEFREFQRQPDLLGAFAEVARCYSASCVFADAQYRQGVMHSGIKPAFLAKAVGQALNLVRNGDRTQLAVMLGAAALAGWLLAHSRPAPPPRDPAPPK